MAHHTFSYTELENVFELGGITIIIINLVACDIISKPEKQQLLLTTLC